MAILWYFVRSLSDLQVQRDDRKTIEEVSNVQVERDDHL